MEWKKAFDRIMDQLYNHPEEMRSRLIGKYNTPTTITVAEVITNNEMAKNAN